LQEQFGARWKHIATFFTARTEINIKSRWNLIQRRILRTAREYHSGILGAIVGNAPHNTTSAPLEELTMGIYFQKEDSPNFFEDFEQGIDHNYIAEDNHWL
jgi:hypothetical protein